MLGQSWGYLGGSWGLLGSTLELSWVMLGLCRGYLGASWVFVVNLFSEVHNRPPPPRRLFFFVSGLVVMGTQLCILGSCVWSVGCCLVVCGSLLALVLVLSCCVLLFMCRPCACSCSCVCLLFVRQRFAFVVCYCFPCCSGVRSLSCMAWVGAVNGCWEVVGQGLRFKHGCCDFHLEVCWDEDGPCWACVLLLFSSICLSCLC